MNLDRRTFLGAMAASLIPASVDLALGVSGPQLKVLVDRYNGVATLDGPPEHVMKFVEAYQTALWPDWRTHKSGAARLQIKNIRFAVYYGGKAGVCIGRTKLFEWGTSIYETAFNAAFKSVEIPYVVIDTKSQHATPAGCLPPS